MASVFLSPSTQQNNITINGGNEEYYMNLIADAMIPYLNASGIGYGRNRPEMTALQAAEEANAGNYDFYLSIHSNAAGGDFSGRVRGAEIYYYPESTEGERAATIFANNYREIYPQPQFVRTIPSGTLIELNKTTMPAILFEVAYHDNLEDFTWLSSNINRIAENLSASVADFLGVSFKIPQSLARGIVTIDSGSLNIRNAPNIRAQVIGKLANGDAVTVLETQNDWYRIRTGNIVGYVNSRYVREA